MSPEQRTQLEEFLENWGKPALAVLMFYGQFGTDEADINTRFDEHFMGEPDIHDTFEEGDEVCALSLELREGRACSEARQDIIRTTLELGFVELATLAAEMDRWIRAHQKAS